MQPSEPRQRSLALGPKPHHRISDPDAVLAALPLGTSDIYRVMAALLAKHNHRHAYKDKVVSHDTMTERGDFLMRFLRSLKDETPFGRVDPRRLASRHVAAMVNVWVRQGKSTKTLHVYLSHLRVFCSWIRKDGLVRPVSYYVGEDSPHAHVTQVARTDKSWSASDVDVEAKIAEAAVIDPWVGLQLRLMRHFGLRAKEAMHFRPHEALRDRQHSRPADAEPFPEAKHFVRLSRGTKGGRVRDVPVLAEAQLELIQECCRIVPRGGFVGRPLNTPQQSRDRFYYVLRKVGITKSQLGVVSHGLRHGYANDRYEEAAGAPSPVRGGTTRTELDGSARLAVARALGHGRERISTYYIGAVQSRRASGTPQDGSSR
jgi:integrase